MIGRRNRKWLGLLLALTLAALPSACGGGGGGSSDDASGGGTGSGTGSGSGVSLTTNAFVWIQPDIPDNRYIFDLSQVNVGDFIVFDFEIRNNGDAVLGIDGLDFTYNAPPDAVESEGAAMSCTYGDDERSCAPALAAPESVGPFNDTTDLRRSLPIQIRFYRYDDEINRTSSLTIRSNNRDGDITIRFVTGESFARIQVSPTRVTFSDVKKGDIDQKFVAVTNSGSQDLTLDRFTLDADAHFTIKLGETEYVTDETTRSGVVMDPSIVLQPNESRQIAVTYEPESAQGADGTLQLHSNDPESEWTAVYIEAVQSGPILTANPDHLEFGPRVVGRESPLQLQLLSRGTEALSITSIAFDAEVSSSDFEVHTGEVTANGEEISAVNPLVIAPNDLVTLNVYYTPDVVNDVDEVSGQPVPDTGTLVIESNAFEDIVELPADGYGVLQDCPVAVILCEEGDEVIPQTTLHLIGDQSFAMVGEVRKWEWSVDQPVGSMSVFMPSPTFPNPQFEANVAGTYTFYLDVWDAENMKSCERATYEVVVIPDEAIHIELLWQTPGDPDETDTGPFAGSDVDLHFIHPDAPSDPDAPDLDGDALPDPYFDQPYDCYWFNPHPDWASFGAENDDDPGLDRDDTDGAGPENINLNVPEPGAQYQVAVHYWNDHGYAAAFVTVRVYIYQSLVYELANVRLINHDLWCVAFVDWPTGQVTLCEAPGGGYRITPNYQHPMFFN